MLLVYVVQSSQNQKVPLSQRIVTELYNVKLVCNVEAGGIKACCLSAVQFCGLEWVGA